MKKLMALSLMALFSLSAFAKRDVHDQKSLTWVKVEVKYGSERPLDLDKTMVKFTKCFDEQCKKNIPLGYKDSYSVNDLSEQRHWEQSKVAAAIAADVGLYITGKLVDATNPFHYNDLAESIKLDVIFDKKVDVDNIGDYIKDLEEVLAKID